MGRIKGCKGDGTEGEVIEGADLVIEVHLDPHQRNGDVEGQQS